MVRYLGARVNVGAPLGNTGVWLLDPYDVNIINGAAPPPVNGIWDTTSNSSTYFWNAPNASSSNVYVEDILYNLASANVVIETGIDATQPNVGSITLEAPLIGTLANPQTLTLIANNDIYIQAAITVSNLNLVLNAVNEINISSNINVASLTSQGATTISSPGTITTTSGQLYSGPVTLGTNVLLTDTGSSSSIQFANTIESAASGGSSSGYGLTVNQTGGAAGSVIFGGTVGLANALGYLTVTSTGNIALNGPSITTSAIGTSSGTQQYIGPVLLGMSTALSTVNGGDISFSNTIGGNFGLTAGAAGNVIFGGPVSVGSLNITGNQIDINTGTITTTGGQIYSSPIVLGTSVLFTDTGSNPIEFAAIDSLTGTSYALNVAKTGTGGVIFGGEVGSVNAPGSLNVSSAGAIAINTTAINTVGEQDINTLVHKLIGQCSFRWSEY